MRVQTSCTHTCHNDVQTAQLGLIEPEDRMVRLAAREARLRSLRLVWCLLGCRLWCRLEVVCGPVLRCYAPVMGPGVGLVWVTGAVLVLVGCVGVEREGRRACGGPSLSIGVLWRCPTLPQPIGCSTIGAAGLSFQVRNGGWAFPRCYDHHKCWCSTRSPTSWWGVWVDRGLYSGCGTVGSCFLCGLQRVVLGCCLVLAH